MNSRVPTKKFNAMDDDWRKLRELEGRVIGEHLLAYVINEFPKEGWERGLRDCFPDEGIPEFISMELMTDSFFTPWFLFNWTAEYDDFGLDTFNPTKTIAANYLELYDSKLKPEEKRFIEAMNQTYYSFYCVVNITVDQSLELKDILRGTTHTVKECQATQMLTPGKLVFTRILTLDGQSIMVGTAPVHLPEECHLSVLDFRDLWLKDNQEATWTPELLREESQFDSLDYFFELLQSAYRPPVLVNTDNEPLEFVTLTFRLSITPEEALKCLMPLTRSKDPSEFLEGAKKDRSGKIKSLEFPWLKAGNTVHKGWENTVMGHLFIKKDRLTLETNSQERGKKGEKLLKNYLGTALVFQKAITEPPEKKLGSLPLSRTGQIKQQPMSKELLESPEARVQIKAMVQAHWKQWLDQPIPGLQNKTPRQAAKTAQGRERLDVLLFQLDSQNQSAPDELLKVDIHYLKNQLGLS